jgi:hypothetical protein
MEKFVSGVKDSIKVQGVSKNEDIDDGIKWLVENVNKGAKVKVALPPKSSIGT